MTDCNTTTTQTIAPKIGVRYRLKLPNGEEVIRRYLGFLPYAEWEDEETKKIHSHRIKPPSTPPILCEIKESELLKGTPVAHSTGNQQKELKK